MRLPRSTFLHLAETSVPAFTSLRRRNQVPSIRDFIPARPLTEEQEDAAGYLPAEAVLLTLSNDLAMAGGFSRDLAFSAIQGHPNVLVPAIRRAEGGEDIWFAHAAFREPGSDAAVLSLCEAGTLSETVEALQAFRYSDGFAPWSHIHRLTHVSVSRAVRQVHVRAAEIGLDLGAIA